jgi:branched-chain amino acid transport system ATP-binding protein
MEEKLQLDQVYVNYGNLQIIQGVSLEVNPGEMISLVGSNGAGKTTLLKAISGVKKIAAGSIYFGGLALHELSPDQIVNAGIVQIPEGRKLFAQMTVKENLELGAYNSKAKIKRKENLDYIYSILPDLKVKSRQLAGSLSGGQQQMVAIGRGIMACPKLLIFDEPSIGLSPLLTDTMFDLIETVKNSGITVLLVEQNVQNALKLADRGYVLEQGRIALTGPAEELLDNEDLKKAYLGL